MSHKHHPPDRAARRSIEATSLRMFKRKVEPTYGHRRQIINALQERETQDEIRAARGYSFQE